MRFSAKDYQDLGVDHLLEKDNAILFAGCGLGKTGMCLMAATEKILLGEAKGFLVVAPLRVATMTWPLEIEKWKSFSWLKVANLRTPEGLEALANREAHFYCINYEMLPKFALWLKGRRQSSWGFDHVIWDELNFAKNPKSKRIRKANLYLQKVKGKWGLTGTPTPNGLLDLFAQVRLIDGGAALGKVFTAYKQRYFWPVDYQQRSWVPHEWAREKIYERLESLCLTLRSEDWLDVPETVEEDLELALPKQVTGVYLELEKELIAELVDGSEVSAANAAVLAGKLLQVTSGAIYKNDEEGWTHLHDAKVSAAAAFVKKSDGPVLVACSFRHEQERLAKAIPGSVRFDSIKGDTALRDLMKKWQAGKVPALISHAASIGHGIDGFQDGCKSILWATLPWSRGLYDQLNARIVRMGQTHRTTIVRLVASGTIDYVVAEKLRAKEEEQTSLLKALVMLRKKS